jgi:MOSC domain-containing protein YiiM
VKHRSRVRKDPTQPNLRQVHLIHPELHEELAGRASHCARPDGRERETSGVELLALPLGARLRLGSEAVVEVKGLRNPCVQLPTRSRRG